MKMEQSVPKRQYKFQTPGNYPEERIQNSSICFNLLLIQFLTVLEPKHVANCIKHNDQRCICCGYFVIVTSIDLLLTYSMVQSPS